VRVTLDNVAALGPRRALTGPAARGDEATIRRHLRALPPGERRAYRAMADAARRLAGEPVPEPPAGAEPGSAAEPVPDPPAGAEPDPPAGAEPGSAAEPGP
jgi:hypothetical protein